MPPSLGPKKSPFISLATEICILCKATLKGDLTFCHLLTSPPPQVAAVVAEPPPPPPQRGEGGAALSNGLASTSLTNPRAVPSYQAAQMSEPPRGAQKLVPTPEPPVQLFGGGLQAKIIPPRLPWP